ncbi:MAG: zinc ribbon domain-containing protein [Gammaproteobacteria bacterium]|nr:zinc ribbon domain-containing protein [Gammaproteobacteria bacterium]MBT8445463.1 zinc ribbon domain-containing protein [Gammaproteobacteria bacterium]NND35661.1 zinc ribbon domain-containing protein [Gammaproteobacteria bacterium]
MPIYEYQCQSCEHIFDVLQKMSEDPLTYCPECGEPKLKKLLSAPNFRLKGGGWYETDFKKDKQRNLHGEKTTADAKKADKPAKASDAAKPSGSSKSSD